jgi:hypothetical protein
MFALILVQVCAVLNGLNAKMCLIPSKKNIIYFRPFSAIKVGEPVNMAAR